MVLMGRRNDEEERWFVHTVTEQSVRAYIL